MYRLYQYKDNFFSPDENVQLGFKKFAEGRLIDLPSFNISNRILHFQ